MSKMTLESIQQILQENGWHALAPVDDQGVETPEQTFVSAYAAVSLCLVDDVEQLQRVASDAEVRLIEAKVIPEVGDKDLYLVFIVPSVSSDSVEALHTIVDDTHGCRKVVLEQAEGGPQDTLSKFPVFGVRETQETNSAVEDDVKAVPGVLGKALKDLASRSPAQILNNLLAGIYKEDRER